MSTIPPEAGFFILLIAGFVGFLLPFFPTLYWFSCLFLALLPGVVLYLIRVWPDRAFYLICAGQPAVIAWGITDIRVGFFAEMILAGMVAGTMGLLTSREDYLYLLLFSGLLLVVALIVQASNHVFFPLIALGAGLALLAGVLKIANYRFRKECAGVHP